MRPIHILGGRYRLEEVLGVGGMSVVWKARDDVLGRAVAVKILAGDFALHPDARSAVLAEAQAVARLSHPNICNVFDYGESLQADGDTVPYVVMELLTGPSLADRLKEGRLAPQEALTFAAEVATGLAAAHAHGVVHRDVKPGNVILTSSGAKVIDFGIAAIAGAPDVGGPGGGILGTLSYLAPERLQGAPVLPASDMFSWGVVLFRLLTGKLPVPFSATPAPLPVMPGIPPKIGELYLSCLAEDPDDRPTAAAAAAVVRVALTVRTPQPSDVLPRGGLPDDDTESVTIGAIADADRRRRRRKAMVLAVGLVAVVATGVFAFLNGAGADRGGATPAKTTAPYGEVFGGSSPQGHANASPTDALPGDVPLGSTPGPEVSVPGVSTTGLTVTAGVNPPAVGPATSFSTRGGTVVVVCETHGPRPTSVQPAPGYYTQQASVVVAALVFFTKPAEGANPSITYRLIITCSSSHVPRVTVASYIGDQVVTPSPTST